MAFTSIPPGKFRNFLAFVGCQRVSINQRNPKTVRKTPGKQLKGKKLGKIQ
jgi:hypothetical protein